MVRFFQVKMWHTGVLFNVITVLHACLLLLQNAALTNQDLISRKIKEYNMMRCAMLTLSLWFSHGFISCHFSLYVNLTFVYIWMHFLFSAPSSRSEPSPKASRQSLSIKQAFRGGKTDSRIHSPHSPKSGDERRALKGKDISTLQCGHRAFSKLSYFMCMYSFRRV